MKRLCSLFLACALVLFLAGCRKAAPPPTPVNTVAAFAIANGEPVINSIDQIEALNDLIEKPGSSYHLILTDGTPDVLRDGHIPVSDKHYNKASTKRIEDGWRAKMNKTIRDAEPDADQIDLADAIEKAARSIDPTMENILVFHASGRSTAGRIDFSRTALAALDITSSVRKLVEAMDAELHGAKVIWYGLGDVNGEQPPLNSEEKKVLRRFYQELLLGLGASEVVFNTMLPLTDCYSFEKQVNLIPTAGTVNFLNECTEEEVQATLSAGEQALTLDQATLSFLPDSLELKDEAAAVDALQSVIKAMEADPSLRVLIVGTTAKVGDAQSCMRFSADRAGVVCDLLARQGIDPERLTPLGLGYSSVFYQNDHVDGVLDQSLAAKNRTVQIVNADSELASQLLNA